MNAFFRFFNIRQCLVALALACSMSALAAEAEYKTIVVLGDSIAAGYGVSPEQAFPGLLQKKVEASGLAYKVVNAGVSGDTTAGGARRISWILKRPVDVLIIELGGNDGLRGIPPEETRANLEKIIDTARATNSNVKILLAGMQMPQNMGAAYTDKFKAIFPAVAEKKQIALLPFLLDRVGGKADLNQPDRIHPNPEGHKIVAETVWASLASLLKATPQAETSKGEIPPQS